jgi:hypothetical protein
MMVSMEAPYVGHTGFQISKSIGCFWHTLQVAQKVVWWRVNIENVEAK